MKSINTKLILSALGIALLATPALAQTSHRHANQDSQRSYSYTQQSEPSANQGAYPGDY
jgi:hypothetical protein